MPPISRRTLLGALAAAPIVLSARPSFASAGSFASSDSGAAFVDSYRTNVPTNLTADTNAAVRILGGMRRVWQTGTAWNTGTVLDEATLRANLRYCVRVTSHRSADDEARAFIQDRQHQSYAVLTGLGPLAPMYKAGALAVTSITTAPTGTPATKIDDAVPPGAPAGSAIGAGSPTSALGQVVTLVNTVRGTYSSGNPSKAAYQYPRPWRMNANSQVADTGELDELGYPIYDSPVEVVPQLLRQRSTTPADDGGFPSGHTNAFHLAALAYAYAVPERFQELVTAAFDLAETRIVAGMHSPADVIGGRILATALAAAILNDPANAELKAAARAQAQAYFPPQPATTAAERAAGERLVTPKLTYGLPRGRSTAPMTVPKGAEVLLETRQPYLTAAQRREVLRTTALGAGWPLLDGPEHWGRLNLFAAADGYGAFDHDVVVTLSAWVPGAGSSGAGSSGAGFAGADSWRNDIGGCGGLTKAGTGSLTLTGHNSYRGGTTVAGGVLTAASRTALGTGDVTVAGGTLRVTEALRVAGSYRQHSGTLATHGHGTVLDVHGNATLGAGSVLEVHGDPGRDVTVLRACRVSGRFAKVVTPPGLKATVGYSRTAVTVRLRRG
ncbi:autotransporter-associated beta strand repeat-containing protein [Paractinoplanes ferrugineus]|uniref:Phosphoesterase n=1 Tax=Paractinoplanes ferrugineus TaxID=113564 RepID=A0A919M973_9ACTN|nr:phosphatase PAP2 family protein [Actinoplanes ferrugineus]GIE11221.1 phosphoesterase [Actinoplanes ferrugineus]